MNNYGSRNHLFLSLLLLLSGICLANPTQAQIGTQIPRVACNPDALISAINNAPSGATLDLTANCPYELSSAPAYSTALPVINKTLTINGNGAKIRRANHTIDYRLFYVTSSGYLTLNNLTVQDGLAPFGQHGGGIYNYGGTVVVVNSRFVSNIVENTDANGNVMSNTGGGAIFNSGVLTVADTAFSSNFGSHGGAILNIGSASINNSQFTENWAAYGGAIDNTNGGMLTIVSSTIDGNKSVNQGGGIRNDNRATLVMSNSTLTDNSAGMESIIVNRPGGGGIYSIYSTVTISNSTIVNNRASNGGGIEIYYTPAPVFKGSVSIGSSIIAFNSAYYSGDDLYNNYISLGYNLITNTTGASFSGDTVTNLTDTAALPLNLQPLADNGGPTLTVALGTGSVAIGNGNCSSLSNLPPVIADQRGANRKAACDVGAYETGGIMPPTISTHPQSQAIFIGKTATLTVVAASATPLTYQWYQGIAPNITNPVGNNSASFTTPLLTETTPYWVQVSNEGWQINSNTAIITVKVAPPSPPDAAPDLGYYPDTHTPELTWNALTWAQGYIVQVADNAQFSGQLVYSAVVDNNNLAVQPDLPNGTYFWRVCAKKRDGSCAGWSATGHFIIDLP